MNEHEALARATRRKLAIGLSALIMIGALLVSTRADAVPPVEQGTCFNGAAWEISAVRKGDKVSIEFRAAPMRERKTWNVNLAYVPINVVKNRSVKTDARDRLIVKDSITSAKPVTAYVWVDYAYALAMTCVAGVTV